MTVEMAEQISSEMGKWFRAKRIEFAMHGEPLLNPNVCEILSVFRKNAPKLQLQLATNGMLLYNNFDEFTKKLFDSGLNILVIDCYDDKLEFFKEKCRELENKDSSIKWYDYYKEKPIHIYSLNKNGNKIKYISLIDDIGKRNGETLERKILNHAGNVNPNVYKKYGLDRIELPLHKTCTRVFREMVVKYDGIVPICCIDWKRECPIGKFPEESLEEIWNGKMFDSVRKILYAKKRIINPCQKCDYNGGFRIGFNTEPEGLSLEKAMANVNQNCKLMKKYMHKNAKLIEIKQKKQKEWW